MKSLKILDDISIKTYCSEKLSPTAGHDYCESCQKCVYDFSKLTRLEASLLLVAKRGDCCVKLTQDARGNVLYNSYSVAYEFKNFLKGFRKALFLFGITFAVNASHLVADSTGPSPSTGHTIIYGEPRLSPSFGYLFTYLEGTFGALFMIASFLAGAHYLILATLRNRSNEIFSAASLILFSAILFVLRSVIL